MDKLSLITGIISAFIAVALGAFGAHGLKTRVGPELLAIWQTAVTYQFFHAIALIGFGLWLKQAGLQASAAYWCFTLGIVIFSGSLYVLVLTDTKVLGAVTPIGGVLFLIGWILWLILVVRN